MVGSWLSWQIDYLLFLQNFRDISGHVLDSFFLHVTMFGELIIPIVVISLVYWCINKKSGMYVFWNYTLGVLTYMFLKLSACIYRPWILNPAVKPLADAIPYAGGYSFPSGHTANAVSVWGGLAVQFWKNKIVRYLSILIVFLVMFSRNYVGVHTPQDVVVSFFVGIILLALTYKLFKWEEKGKNRDLIIVGVVTIATILTTVYILLKPYPQDYLNGVLLFDPTNAISYAIGRFGAVLGIFYGWLIEKRFVNFEIENVSITKRVFRYIIGIALLIPMLSYGKPVFVDILGKTAGESTLFFILGLFVTAIYPYIFKKARI